jgi:hypothetical protein
MILAQRRAKNTDRGVQEAHLTGRNYVSARRIVDHGPDVARVLLLQKRRESQQGARHAHRLVAGRCDGPLRGDRHHDGHLRAHRVLVPSHRLGTGPARRVPAQLQGSRGRLEAARGRLTLRCESAALRGPPVLRATLAAQLIVISAP